MKNLLRCWRAGLLAARRLRNLLLPLECTADPLRQVRQAARPQLCPRKHPGSNANNEVTERKKGDRSCFHEKTRQQSSGTPAIQDLAFTKAPPAYAVVCWTGGLLRSPPPAVQGMTHDHR